MPDQKLKPAHYVPALKAAVQAMRDWDDDYDITMHWYCNKESNRSVVDWVDIHPDSLWEKHQLQPDEGKHG